MIDRITARLAELRQQQQATAQQIAELQQALHFLGEQHCGLRGAIQELETLLQPESPQEPPV